MYGTAVMVIMLLLRVVIPVSLLLWIGEVVQRRHPASFNRISGHA